MTTQAINLLELLLHICSGFTRTKNSLRIEAGLLTHPLKNGRINIWPLPEIEILDRAIIMGKSDDDLREIVKLLEAERTSSDPISHPTLTQLRTVNAAARARTAEAEVSVCTQTSGRV